ncbi:MAG: hypothetical protein IBX61_05955 [Thermoleophilia bacterium]|nr:hypothetical protein [Thermoleophilia bacterium]
MLPERANEAVPRVLVICGPPDFDAGLPAGSLWDLAEALAGANDVILAIPEITQASHPGFAVVFYNRRNIKLLARDSDMAVFSHSVLATHPQLMELGSLKAVQARDLAQGKVVGGRPLAADDIVASLDEGEMIVLSPAARAEANAGFAYYLERIGHHLRAGGPLRAASRGGSLIKRKIRKRQRM